MIKLKEGVTMQGLKPVMRPVLIVVKQLMDNYEVYTMVTSATDGEHSAGSLHYYGYALDFRTRHLEPNQRASLLAQLNAIFEDNHYKCILHDTHLHIEYTGAI
jgi:hypothetical protein